MEGRHKLPIVVEIAEYRAGDRSMSFSWDDDYAIRIVELEPGRIELTATRGGLASLARVLLTMAQPDVSDGMDVHLDESTGLEPGSIELKIVKDDRIL